MTPTKNTSGAAAIGSKQNILTLNVPTTQINQDLNKENCDENRMQTRGEKRKADNSVTTWNKKLKTNEVAEHELQMTEAENTTPSSSTDSEQLSMQSMTRVPCDVDVTPYPDDIYQYLKEKEFVFPICDYMPFQKYITKGMRSLLVDWMVELQESFELHHETLYLAVKIVDSYLSDVILHKEDLQLLGAAALLIACKYDEHAAPQIEDLLYMCNGAYTRSSLISMERTVLFKLDFEVSFPLSYNFLRHYARSANVSIPTLTLARYILEMSLLNYEAVTLRGSKMAAAALFMALRMHGVPKPWTRTLEDCSSYELEEFATNVTILNTGLHKNGNCSDTIFKTIPTKYAHRVFHEVAKVPLMIDDELFETYHAS